MAGGPTGPLWSVLVVVDNYSFNYSNNNVSKATEVILNVINVTDSIYLWLGLHVSLIGIEIWNQGNLINVEQHMSQLLDSFSEWKSIHLYPRLPPDLGDLFVCKDFPNIFKLAWISGMCYCHFGLAVYKFLKDKSIAFILQWSLLTNWVIVLVCLIQRNSVHVGKNIASWMPIIQIPVLLATAVMEVILTSLTTKESVWWIHQLLKTLSHWNNVATR